MPQARAVGRGDMVAAVGHPPHQGSGGMPQGMDDLARES